ncbi:Catabolite repressor/activator [Vibrio stylophorae]|uniref:Catabolite repressor/activator n=1 Tax=Vibrio stylophorae TaxID=659351 RepID=A0ABN8DXS5_9VIBR|nr:LacI family DNA-binding transcriptional regulator [Vibrio stylophorae]CAH0535544.1 Catabolite repressor/activator [Vibrio stylophorae]
MKLDEIARLAGVSKTTASYVINGKAEQYRISVKTQAKVMAVVAAHNYRPNHAASSLRAGSSQSFGLIIPDLENSSYAKLAKLLERDARRAGYQLIISCSDDEPETEKQVADNLVTRRIDALFVASCLPHHDSFYPAIQAKGIPVIALDRMMDDEQFCSVISEDFEGAKRLTRALSLQSCARMAVIGAAKDLSVSKDREQGIRAALQDTSIEMQIYYGDSFSREEGERLAQALLANASAISTSLISESPSSTSLTSAPEIKAMADESCFPDALICTAYPLFEGVLDALAPYPEYFHRVQLATFGDNRLLDFLPVKVQSLAQQFELIVDAALTMALNALSTQATPCVELIARKLKRR